MVRIILEVVLAMLLAAAATFAVVSGLKVKTLEEELATAQKTLTESKEKITELEAENEKLAEAAKPPEAPEHKAPHWGYEGEIGPANWGKEFPLCGNGKSQSPIDIRAPFQKAGFPLKFDYKPGALKVVNNGHTLQVAVEPGSKLTINDQLFELVQFHFHRPSEETVEGKPSAMVAHFVHKNEAGQLAVVGVLLKEGREHPLIKSVWTNAPQQEGEASPPGMSINPAALLPTNRGYFAFEGSLTTPPCTEGVWFFILKNPVEISKEQVASFPFKMNARPVQPLNGRKVMAY